MPTQRTRPTLGRAAAFAAFVVLGAPIAFDWISFVSAFQRAQIAAQTLATDEFAKRLGSASRSGPQRTFKAFRRVREYPPRSGGFIGNADAYRVRVATDWRSPLFRLRHRIVASATVLLVPTDHPAQARIVIAE